MNDMTHSAADWLASSEVTAWCERSRAERQNIHEYEALDRDFKRLDALEGLVMTSGLFMEVGTPGCKGHRFLSWNDTEYEVSRWDTQIGGFKSECWDTLRDALDCFVRVDRTQGGKS